MVPLTESPQKREARSFEPPPWERDRFEKLAERKRQAEQPPVEEPESGGEAEAEFGPQAGGSAEEPIAGPGEEADPLAAVEVEAMLLALQEEEPGSLESAWKIGAAASVVVVTIGAMLVVWGAVAMARAGSAGAAGMMGSAIMSVMGALFTALGVWLGVRSLRQRGVL